jgi:hypothetical protein
MDLHRKIKLRHFGVKFCPRIGLMIVRISMEVLAETNGLFFRYFKYSHVGVSGSIYRSQEPGNAKTIVDSRFLGMGTLTSLFT